MKHTSITLLALVLSSAFAFVACAGGGDTEAATGSSGGVGGHGTTTGSTTTSTSTGSGPGVCAPKCTTDAECETSCPASGGNPYCCDLATETCYQSTLSMCPANPPTGSTTSSSGGY